MKLVGMLDSPYVRRVAICLKLLGLKFEHHSLSVFSTFDEFRRINPVVKVPTLVLDGGEVLMDSCLILEYIASLTPGRSLWPQEPAARIRATRLVGLALATNEKAVQVVYEHKLRPVEKLHEPWLERVHVQLFSALGELENELVRQPLTTEQRQLGQAEVSIVAAWSFTQLMLPTLVLAKDFPAVAAYAEGLEGLSVFIETPMV
jgi:glutathione S-transferase